MEEARRVIRLEGWLIVYDNYFAGSDNNLFNAWHQQSYLERYPSPPREWPSFSTKGAAQKGFRLVDHEMLGNTITFTLEELIDFFVTQSNIIAAVEGGQEKIAETRAWLQENLQRFYDTSAMNDFLFQAPIWYLRRFR
jgi:hypothetical protein